MRSERALIDLRRGMMTCGKENDGMDWRSLSVRYTKDRQVHGPELDCTSDALSVRSGGSRG